MAGPLEGIRVLSFARALAGPFCIMILCDLGAEILKIEEPEKGDFARSSGPFIQGVSTYFMSINRGQKSVTLDLKNDKAKEIIFKLIKKVEILVENYRPGVMERLRFSYANISQHNPGIIYASISGFGQSGPYASKPAFDMIAQGMGGTVSITGEVGGSPTRVGFSIGDIGAALFGAVTILAALHEREKSGKGQWIDISMLDSQVALCENAIARYLATREIPQPLGSRHPLLTPFQIFPTKDYYIVLIIVTEEDWKKFCQIVGREKWLDDRRFQSNQSRIANYKIFEPLMNELMGARTTAEWLHLLGQGGIMCGPVNNIAQVISDPQIQKREMILEVTHKRIGKIKIAGTPMKLSRTPCKIEKACPDVGEHTDEILRDYLGMSQEEIKNLRTYKII